MALSSAILKSTRKTLSHVHPRQINMSSLVPINSGVSFGRTWPRLTSDWQSEPTFDFGLTPTSRLFKDMDKILSNTESTLLQPIAIADLVEKENSYDCYIDLPGCEDKDITVSISNDNRFLDIVGERKKVCDRETDSSIVQERSYGKISRRMWLPENADTDKAEAKMKNGTLSVVFPKTVGGPTKKILPLGSA